MSICSLEESPFLHDLLHLSIRSKPAGPISSQINTILIDDAEESEGLVIFPVDQDAVARDGEGIRFIRHRLNWNSILNCQSKYY